ncbi:MAG TPA: tRNA (N6-isopentenyl adenosine(37)-C2)-methylthiotransferase MiaB [Sedimentisphaerales bacterium]|nr:tRNA (N6-isopentenyl adenosine(37)-C2)-methylthiotransferase MiaB [Sedimentisphaerales bacterium]
MSIGTVHIRSFGCQMNKLDTELVTAALEQKGFAFTDQPQQADVVLINTCSVRRHAEERVLSLLGNLRHIKQSRPEMTVAVIGCMAQRLGAALLDRPEVDIVCGPAQIPQITELVTEVMNEKKKIAAVTDKIRNRSETQVQALEDFESVADFGAKALPNQAYVRVMRGCNNFCSYCVVPFVRGPEVCRQPKAIIEQIRNLADQGVKTVTLLGQTVNSYKYVQGDRTYCLADLLAMASDIRAIKWLKFVTSYPQKEFFNEIMQAMADLPKVCSYLHLPAQSGSDKILKAMNRHYTAGEYLQLLDTARAIVPDLAAAGDFIVGFPGESEEDFQATVQLLKKANYKNAFIFKYSARPGTTAQKGQQDDAPEAVKKQRNNTLLGIQAEISGRLSSPFMGREVEVMVEGLSKKPHLNNAGNKNHPQLVGRTAGDYIVVFNGPVSLAGEFAKVKITKTFPLTLFGQLVSSSAGRRPP